ncbi:hypothetical protein BpHYR1_036469, partial [Brachionus plicatilis]
MYINRRFSQRESIAALKNQDGQLYTNRENICELLNEFFHSVFENTASKEQIIHATNVFHIRAQPDPAFSVEDIVTAEKVLKKLESLQSDKTSGVDQV